jgi:hypothetical protein
MEEAEDLNSAYVVISSAPASDRVKSGLANARANGKILVRPPLRKLTRKEAPQTSSEAFAKFFTLLLFSMGYKAVDLIRSAWKRF